MKHTVEYIPVEWLIRAAWAASCGAELVVYTRSVEIDRTMESLQSFNLAELLRM